MQELLALEEQIGDVKTGLTEEYIINNLKTSLHSSQTASQQSDELPRSSPEAEACTICQVLYVICGLQALVTKLFSLLYHNQEDEHLLL